MYLFVGLCEREKRMRRRGSYDGVDVYLGWKKQQMHTELLGGGGGWTSWNMAIWKAVKERGG
jgi:hypothetical protein